MRELGLIGPKLELCRSLMAILLHEHETSNISGQPFADFPCKFVIGAIVLNKAYHIRDSLEKVMLLRSRRGAGSDERA